MGGVLERLNRGRLTGAGDARPLGREDSDDALPCRMGGVLESLNRGGPRVGREDLSALSSTAGRTIESSELLSGSIGDLRVALLLGEGCGKDSENGGVG